MKMMQGALASACWNMSRTRAAPTPTNISTKSEPERLKNGTPASPAIALASSVLPVPGGPTSSTPLGMRPPSRWYFSGVRRKSTTSRTSSTASSMPATSLNVTPRSSWAYSLPRLRPNDIGEPAPPRRRSMKIDRRPATMITSRIHGTCCSQRTGRRLSKRTNVALVEQLRQARRRIVPLSEIGAEVHAFALGVGIDLASSRSLRSSAGADIDLAGDRPVVDRDVAQVRSSGSVLPSLRVDVVTSSRRRSAACRCRPAGWPRSAVLRSVARDVPVTELRDIHQQHEPRRRSSTPTSNSTFEPVRAAVDSSPDVRAVCLAT